jgi:hypothetical protein
MPLHWLFAALILFVTAVRDAQTALRLVVVEGEDAVNIIQQRTAVAPVAEVRDRNDQAADPASLIGRPVAADEPGRCRQRDDGGVGTTELISLSSGNVLSA